MVIEAAPFLQFNALSNLEIVSSIQKLHVSRQSLIINDGIFLALYVLAFILTTSISNSERPH